MSHKARDIARAELWVGGAVQGAGLRPWVARRARSLGLAGSVRNSVGGLELALEGPATAIRALLAELRRRGPAGVCVEGLEARWADPRGERGFRIAESELRGSGRPTRIPPDRPTCEACLRELFDPRNRRYRYAFTHCAGCGPRASVLRALPYDRERTSLAEFPPCPACTMEYEDANDRRFHAQTLTCPACGPKLAAHSVREPHGSVPHPVERAAAVLREGGIVAVKGYGGYHLVADATSRAALARLRQRKGRPTKPFAVMVSDAAAAGLLVELGAQDRLLLEGAVCAVVVAPRRALALKLLAPEVCPVGDDLGLVLPYAPVHYLLFFGPGARPGNGETRFPALVFTSANVSGEPTESENASAGERLAQVADLFLDHERAVTRPSDDPVFRSAASGPIPLRLSRSTTPVVVGLPAELSAAEPGFALGGDLKCAPALLASGELHLDAHVADLGSERSVAALEARLRSLTALLGVAPAWIAHDEHPGYASTALAHELSLPTVSVQHHHAHALSCCAENGHFGPALALVLDGAGWGSDGTLWGGELLRVEPGGFGRLAHLETVLLPGGDRAAREPWRAAARWLTHAFPDASTPALAWHARRSAQELAVLERMAERRLNAQFTSSCGRLFDAVASLLDACDRAHHEGEAAFALEGLAASAAPEPGQPWELDGRDPTAGRDAASGPEPAVIPVADMIRTLVLERAGGAARERVARRFHLRLAQRLAETAARAARDHALTHVALSGGCFQNRLLLECVRARLEAAGCRVLIHHRVPPNDGGLAVGQLVAATHQRVHNRAGSR